MIKGRYTKVDNRWCVWVNGNVATGDQVEIPRPNGTSHVYTVAKVIARHGGVRICEIVPCLYYRQSRGLVEPSLQPLATGSSKSDVTGRALRSQPLGASYRAYEAAPNEGVALAEEEGHAT